MSSGDGMTCIILRLCVAVISDYYQFLHQYQDEYQFNECSVYVNQRALTYSDDWELYFRNAAKLLPTSYNCMLVLSSTDAEHDSNIQGSDTQGLLAALLLDSVGSRTDNDTSSVSRND
jgi:hypothetical protein